MKTATIAVLGLALATTTDALSMGQVASLWKQNGGSSSSCPTAVAVAWAESRGNPSATGRNPGSYDRGLWQINSKWHPDVSDSCAYNAACNAKNAVRISSGGSRWSPWATYNDGLHNQFMSQARSACRSSRDEIANWLDMAALPGTPNPMGPPEDDDDDAFVGASRRAKCPCPAGLKFCPCFDMATPPEPTRPEPFEDDDDVTVPTFPSGPRHRQKKRRFYDRLYALKGCPGGSCCGASCRSNSDCSGSCNVCGGGVQPPFCQRARTS